MVTAVAGTAAALVGSFSACGARDDLRPPGDAGSSYGGGFAAGPGGAGAAPGGAAGAGGGAGGSAPTCEALDWAGDPVVMPGLAGSPAVRPRLVPVGGGDVALAFESPMLDVTLLASARLTPFESWPPAVGTADAHFPIGPTWTRFAVGPGEPGQLGFIAPDASGMVLGRTEPGANGSTFVPWTTLTGDGKFLARSPDGSYLAGYGNASGLLWVDVISSFSPAPTVTPVPTLGCAMPEVVGAAIPSPSGGFLVASTADQPFDECVDPDLPGPPLFVQLVELAPGRTSDLAFFEAGAPITRVELVPRTGGATLLYRTDGTNESHVVALDEAGSVVHAPEIEHTTAFDDAIGAWFDGYAYVLAADDARSPILRLDLYRPGQLEPVASIAREDVDAADAVAVLASADGRSFLLATSTGGPVGQLVLVRADCVP